MNTQKSITIYPGENTQYNLKLETIPNDDGGKDILLSVNSWIDQSGGSDGEAIIFSIEEFEMVIKSMQSIINFAEVGE